MKKHLFPFSGIVMAVAGVGLSLAVNAQSADTSSGMSSSNWAPAVGQRYIGLNGGSTDLRLGDNATSYDLSAGAMWNKNFGLEVGMTDFGTIRRPGNSVDAYGLSVRAVGVAPLTESFSAFAKLGTMYTRTKVTSGASVSKDNSWGMTYGVGVNYDFTRQLAAVVEWDQTNLNLAGSSDHINTTSLGLKYRF